MTPPTDERLQAPPGWLELMVELNRLWLWYAEARTAGAAYLDSPGARAAWMAHKLGLSRAVDRMFMATRDELTQLVMAARADALDNRSKDRTETVRRPEP